MKVTLHLERQKVVVGNIHIKSYKCLKWAAKIAKCIFREPILLGGRISTSSLRNYWRSWWKVQVVCLVPHFPVSRRKMTEEVRGPGTRKYAKRFRFLYFAHLLPALQDSQFRWTLPMAMIRRWGCWGMKDMSLGLKFRLSKWLCPRLLMEPGNDGLWKGSLLNFTEVFWMINCRSSVTFVSLWVLVLLF